MDDQYADAVGRPSARIAYCSGRHVSSGNEDLGDDAHGFECLADLFFVDRVHHDYYVRSLSNQIVGADYQMSASWHEPTLFVRIDVDSERDLVGRIEGREEGHSFRTGTPDHDSRSSIAERCESPSPLVQSFLMVLGEQLHSFRCLAEVFLSEETASVVLTESGFDQQILVVECSGEVEDLKVI